MIGILGGTFDPIHLGHLRVALDVLEALPFDEIRFIPLRTPVHRGQPHASSEQRLHMVELAVSDQPGFTLDDREMDRNQPSYSLHTLQSLKQEYAHESLCLLLGTDAYQDFLNWHEPEQILELAHLVVMQRPGYQLPEDPLLQDFTARRLSESGTELSEIQSGAIYFQNVTQLEISASDIRHRIGAGKSARYLLPPRVEKYIQTEQIYLNA